MRIWTMLLFAFAFEFDFDFDFEFVFEFVEEGMVAFAHVAAMPLL